MYITLSLSLTTIVTIFNARHLSGYHCDYINAKLHCDFNNAIPL